MTVSGSASTRNGVIFAFLAYTMWGLFPLYFKLPYRLSLVIAVTGAMAAGLAADEAAARLQWQRRRAAQPVAEEEDA